MQQDKISLLNGLGEKTASYFNDVNIFTMYDLVHNLPKRYNSFVPTDPNDVLDVANITISGVVSSRVALKKFKASLNTMIFTIESHGLAIKCLIFGKEYLRFQLTPGKNACFFGSYNPLKKEMYVRELFLGNDNLHIDVIYGYRNIPDSKVTRYVKQIYDNYVFKFKEEIPEYFLEKYKLLGINEYIKLSHFPLNIKNLKEIERRKKYDFYLKRSLELECLRYQYDMKNKKPKTFDINEIERIKEKLPYKLTKDQDNALNDIFTDMMSNTHMNRLVQGDVGSGKTIVALLAIYAAYKAGYQSALMVPSEILASQHYKQFESFLGHLGVRVAFLTSSIRISSRRQIIEDTRNGRVDVLIGTQSILNDDVKFDNIGLIIIDEQHRFGVVERAKLQEKGNQLDSLFLTATPIPRTLGIARFGDLSISSIHTKPSGRKRVETKVVDENNLGEILKNLRHELSLNHQAFVVVPMINENENINTYNIFSCEKMLKDAISDVKVAAIHGEMNAEERKNVMNDFKDNKIGILVSTTIIEVGIDIKNATMMVIFNAERFGMASLHQLRGRVGRNSLDSKCFLVTNDIFIERLKAIESSHDCFEISEIDYKLRGPGEFLGESQSGFFMNLDQDVKIYEIAKQDAATLYRGYVEGANDEIIVTNTINRLSIKNIKLN